MSYAFNLFFVELPKVARSLAQGSLVRFIQLVFLLWFFILTRKLFGMKGDYKLTGLYKNSNVTFYLRYITDIAVLREIFVLGEYDWCPFEPSLIVDIGAHFGDTALFYNARYPKAKIIAVEPSPENYERLCKHTSGIKNIITIQAAVGGESGTVQMSLGKATFGHSLYGREAEAATVLVRQTTLPLLLEECGVASADLIKFDIEGSEFDMLRGLLAYKLANAYIGELHFDISPQSDDSYLETFSGMQVSIEELPQKERKIIRAHSE